MIRLFYRVVHSRVTISAIVVLLAFLIISTIVSATAFRVNLPVYPGAQQVKTSSDSEHSILTFVTNDDKAQVQDFYKEAFSPGEWYYASLGNQSQQVCCYMHIKNQSYLSETNLPTSITADYDVGINFSTEQKNMLVTVTARKNWNDFYHMSFDYSP